MLLWSVLLVSYCADEISALLKELQSPDRNTRLHALQAISTYAPKRHDVTIILTKVLGDKDEKIRLYAAIGLVRISPGNTSAMSELIKIAKQPAIEDDDLIAAEALAKTQAKKHAVPTFIKGLKNSWLRDGSKRDRVDYFHLCVFQLGDIGTEAREAVPALAAQLKNLSASKDNTVAIYVAGAMVKIQRKNPQARAYLLRSLGELKGMLTSQDVLFALEILQVLGPEAKEAIANIKKLVKSTDARIRKAAQATLKAVQEPVPLRPKAK
jgi:HEAT repeat protein